MSRGHALITSIRVSDKNAIVSFACDQLCRLNGISGIARCAPRLYRAACYNLGPRAIVITLSFCCLLTEYPSIMSLAVDGLSHDRKTAMPALAVSIEVVTSVLLWMRIGSRFTKTHNTLGVDDVLISAAWITGLGLTVAVLLGVYCPLPNIITFLTFHRRHRKVWTQSAYLGCPARALLQRWIGTRHAPSA